MEIGITNFRLNLRAGPGTTEVVIVTLTPGSEFRILNRIGDWLQVQLGDGREGFVSAGFVLIRRLDPPPVTEPVSPGVVIAEPPPPPPPPPPAEPPALLRVTPAIPLLNVRAQPMIAPSNVVGQARPGEALVPLEGDQAVKDKVATRADQNLWLRVRLPNGTEGFAAAWLLSLMMEEAGRGGGERRDVVIIDPTDLYGYIDTIPDRDYPMPPEYEEFWSLRTKLGLPAPFDVSPTKPTTFDYRTLIVNGFGPNTFAFKNWQSFYRNVNGMHNGLDHIVPAGTPLLALGDGIVVGTGKHWQFMGSRFENTLTIWCFLPDHIRDSQGRRMLSNVLVAYGHMADNTMVQRHEIVQAGQVIGTSGYPINVGQGGVPAPQPNNAHLHYEVHLLSGDPSYPSRKLLSTYNRPQPFSNIMPLNPMLLFSKRLVKFHLHQGRVIGFGGAPSYPTKLSLARVGLENWQDLNFFSVAQYRYSRAVIWGMSKLPWSNDIFDMRQFLDRVQTIYEPFEPYPMDFV